MATLNIELEQGKTTYRPGDTVAGSVRWQFDTAPRQLSLRLVWYTQGKGDEDVGMAEETIFEQLGLSDQRMFRLTVPNGPYSFSGTLISLTWALELVAQPGDHFERQDIVVAPTGREVLLQAVPGQEVKLPFGLKLPEATS